MMSFPEITQVVEKRKQLEAFFYRLGKKGALFWLGFFSANTIRYPLYFGGTQMHIQPQSHFNYIAVLNEKFITFIHLNMKIYIVISSYECRTDYNQDR